MVQAPSEFDLADALDRLKVAIEKDLEKGPKPNEFISVFQKISGTETDRKSASDQTLKLILQQKLSDGKPASEVVIVLQYGTSAARKVTVENRHFPRKHNTARFQCYVCWKAYLPNNDTISIDRL